MSLVVFHSSLFISFVMYVIISSRVFFYLVIQLIYHFYLSVDRCYCYIIILFFNLISIGSSGEYTVTLTVPDFIQSVSYLTRKRVLRPLERYEVIYDVKILETFDLKYS
jgi:hypothetical protein